MSEVNELQLMLKLLSQAYAGQLPEKIKQIEQSWRQFPIIGWDQDEFLNLHRLVHGLTGSGKTFGFSALSDSARELENYLYFLGQAKTELNAVQRDKVSLLLAGVSLAANQPDKPGSAQVNLIPVKAVRAKARNTRRIFVVEHDRELAWELKTQLKYFEYDVKLFYTLEDFRRAIRQDSRGVVLMDINFPEDPLGGVHVMPELQRNRQTPLQVIFLSSHSELEVRLEAVRAGGVAYLMKPVNLGVLVDKLDELTSASVAPAPRVLIVDDDVNLSNYHARVLEHAGMSVKVVNDPLDVMRPLQDFSPDLILVDIYMPGCSGLELAKVIRQIDAFVSIPIVFLSSETNLDKQLAALVLGADDFLTKSIEAHQLVSSINSRIKRSLLLRSFMVRDGLTGLLNHIAIKDQLVGQIAQAKRHARSITFAMLDIDHFKKVNDSYGHPVGDRVIKSLSRLLKQRLRENDLVGRYGGEEFAVVLIDADGAAAMKVMDAIRHDFSQLRHLAKDQEFSASFSCGLAEMKNFDNASRLTDAADMALYKAKHAGRNQVVLADASYPA
ncbi:MAG: diguanylate cyclase [Gallionella sp.]|nr:diguanylate cyclase [Gallionella sp.]